MRVNIKSLGRVIRAERERQSIGFIEFAARCKIDKSSLSRIESGKMTPTLVTLCKIARQLGQKPGELLNLTDIFSI